MTTTSLPPQSRTAGDHDLPTVESTGGTTFVMETFDGLRLRCAHWPAPGATASGGVMVLPGRSEFIEKYLETVGFLRARNLSVWMLDWRCQGGSARLHRNPHKCHVADYGDYLMDLQLFAAEHLRGWNQGPLVMLTHSMGGNVGLRFLHDHPNVFDRAVHSAPMIGVPAAGGATTLFARALAEASCAVGLHGAYVPGRRDYGPHERVFAANPLTSDEVRFLRMHAFIDRDLALALGGPTLGWLRAGLRSSALLLDPAYAGAIATPNLVVCAGDDRIVDNRATYRLCRSGLPNARIETIPGARHELLGERDDLREVFWSLFDGFVGTAPA